MENASKALIIAGAILLAILLISLGIMIFQQAQDTVTNSGMSEAELSAFNTKFLKYEGTKRGSEVKSLINEVIASNSTDSNKDLERVINVTYPNGDVVDAATDPDSITTSGISTSTTYNVELTYTSGRVSGVLITNAGTTTTP